jgi:Zn-dependent protease with chaperone function
MRMTKQQCVLLSLWDLQKIAAMFCLCAVLACCSRLPSASVEADASANTMQWLASRYGIISNEPVRHLLVRVTRRLASGLYETALDTEVGGADVRQFHDYPWQVVVLDMDTPNAFSIGAGSILITRGMFLETMSEATLAAVVAHEMSHQILGHTREALSKAIVSETTPRAAFTLEQELAADKLSLKLLYVARYNLAHAPQALTIDYRPFFGTVAGMPPAWLTLRMSNMEQQIAGFPPYLPATDSTREFARVRNLIGRNAG